APLPTKVRCLMIQFTRALARRFRALLRRSVLEHEPRGLPPPIACRAGEHGLILQAHRGEVGLCYHHTEPQPPGELTFPARPLADVEGRGEDPVLLEPAG